eukprot:7043643-Prymnesium_polylepis.1
MRLEVLLDRPLKRGLDVAWIAPTDISAVLPSWPHIEPPHPRSLSTTCTWTCACACTGSPGGRKELCEPPLGERAAWYLEESVHHGGEQVHYQQAPQHGEVVVHVPASREKFDEWYVQTVSRVGEGRERREAGGL